MQLAPVVLFVYRRPDHTRRLLQSLRENALADSSELFIFSDAPGRPEDDEGVRSTRDLLRQQYSGDSRCNLIVRNRHRGCAASVIEGVSEVLEKYTSAIVLEDDLVLSAGFLQFANRALTTYAGRRDIFSIGGYTSPGFALPGDYPYDVYLSPRSTSLGWATWRDRWRTIDWSVGDFSTFIRDAEARRKFDRGGNDLSRMLDMQMRGELDAWDIRFFYAQHRQQGYTVLPRHSFVDHRGFDSLGTHAIRASASADISKSRSDIPMPPDLAPDARVVASVESHFSTQGVAGFLNTRPVISRIVRMAKQRLGIRRRILPG